jgi:hypothetical protein
MQTNLNQLLHAHLLSKRLPGALVGKITCYLLSYGTPSSNLIRDYIEQNMRKLPAQSSENNRTLWRYRAYASQYSFSRDLGPSQKSVRYQTDVRYEIILALVESDDCLVAVKSRYFLGELKEFIQYTLNKLFEIRIHMLNTVSSEKCGTPSAILIKKHVKEMKRNKFTRDFV